MILITDGFTSISANADPIDELQSQRPRSATGARVTLEFSRDTALPPGQPVRVRYDFAGDGMAREVVATPLPTRTLTRWGHAAIFSYRLSHWIAPAALEQFAPNVRYRTEAAQKPRHDHFKQSSVTG